MKKVLIFCFAVLTAQTAFAQPAVWSASKIKFENGDTSFINTAGHLKDFIAAYFSGGGTVSNVTVTNANGFNGTVANPTSTPNITLTTTVTGMIKGDATAISAATAGTDYSAGTSALGTGILKSTTGTGALSIAIAGDFPTLNQNTTGSAATLTTSRLIYGNGFDGSANVTGVIGSSFGGTGNGFTAFTGPASTEKTFTLPNASATILTSNAAVTAAQGGTGQTTYTTGDLLQATGATTLSKLGAVATGNALISGGVGAASTWGKIGLGTHVSGTLTVGNGGTGATTLSGTLFGNATGAFTATALGGDVTLYGSNGTAPIYYTPAITHNDAGFGYSRNSAEMRLNIPNATASLGGIVSNTTQSFAGNKTWGGTHTQTGLLSGNGGIVGVSNASQAAIHFDGVVKESYRTVTSTITVDESDHIVYVGTLTADITINLPSCNATRDGWKFQFFKKGSDAFAFILDPAGAETFWNGAATRSVYGEGNTVNCICENGLGWTTPR